MQKVKPVAGASRNAYLLLTNSYVKMDPIQNIKVGCLSD